MLVEQEMKGILLNFHSIHIVKVISGGSKGLIRCDSLMKTFL